MCGRGREGAVTRSATSEWFSRSRDAPPCRDTARVDGRRGRARGTAGAARRAATGLPRRRGRRDAGSAVGTGSRARSRARSGPRRASGKQGFARDGRMASAGRRRARSRRGGRATASTSQTLSSRWRSSRARPAGRRRGPVARHGAGRDVPSARGPANPKHALAMRPGPARRLERATRGRRGDGDFGNWRRVRTILCNPDYYVTRCTCAADRGTPDGATGVFRHPRVRKNANSRPHG